MKCPSKAAFCCFVSYAKPKVHRKTLTHCIAYRVYRTWPVLLWLWLAYPNSKAVSTHKHRRFSGEHADSLVRTFLPVIHTRDSQWEAFFLPAGDVLSCLKRLVVCGSVCPETTLSYLLIFPGILWGLGGKILRSPERMLWTFVFTHATAEYFYISISFSVWCVVWALRTITKCSHNVIRCFKGKELKILKESQSEKESGGVEWVIPCPENESFQ